MSNGLKDYGVLKGNVADFKDTSSKNHFQIKIDTDGQRENMFRVAVNVRSSEADSPDLLYYLDQNFKHPLLDRIGNFKAGFNPLDKSLNSGSLDYIRNNLFPVSDMKIIPATLPGPENDLVDLLEFYIQKAKLEKADVYIYGQRWFPKEAHDQYFDDIPDQGVHDTHMNQGNPHPGQFDQDNGIWQDGGLLLNYPKTQQWVALFLRFQSQSVHTDDHGNPLSETDTAVEPLYILAALINPMAQNDQGQEKVILFNPTDRAVSIEGWSIADLTKGKEPLRGAIPSGGVLNVNLSGKNVVLGNGGGIITLFNSKGVKVDGVSYTQKDAEQPGRWARF
jgi:uncharacterized protein YukJ